MSSARTRIERDFDPDAVRRLKAAADRDLSVGGPELAAHAFVAGLVDEVHLFLVPDRRGGRHPRPADNVRLPLVLVEHRRFACGFVYLRYRCDVPPAVTGASVVGTYR